LKTHQGSNWFVVAPTTNPMHQLLLNIGNKLIFLVFPLGANLHIIKTMSFFPFFSTSNFVLIMTSLQQIMVFQKVQLDKNVHIDQKDVHFD